MSHDTHRRTLARKLAAASDLNYQQALERVTQAAEQGTIRGPYDQDGFESALAILLDAPEPTAQSPAATATTEPATTATTEAAFEETEPTEPTGQRGPKVRIINFSMISRCPKRSILPAHFNDDGTCRCGERDQAKAAVTAAQSDVDAARQHLKTAQENLAAARDSLRTT